jgi:hypothetical protein
MLETVSTISFVLLAVVGAADLVRFLMNRMLRTNNQGRLYLILTIHGHEEGAEIMLTSAIERLKWIAGEDKKVICVDCGMDEETRKICRIISAQNHGVEICTPDELAELLGE